MKLLFKILLIILSAGVLAATPFINTNSFTENNTFTKQKNERKCTFCHNDIIKHKVLHAPVADDCESCHQSTGKKHPRYGVKGFTLTEKTPELCYICHEQKNNKHFVHTPVKKGKCGNCHSPHGTEYQHLLFKSPTSSVCKKCHNINSEKNPNIHAALELDGCGTCHDAHQSDFPNLLIEKKSDLCVTCHDNISNELKSNFIHPPFEDDCSNCHNPHNSKENFLLNTATPNLCFNCHDDIKTIIEDSKFTHKVSENKPECIACHSPHASSHTDILISEQTDLCLNCHNKEIITDTKHIENIKEKLQNKKYIHPPAEDACSNCHNPHASDNNSLLTSAFPSSEYAKATTATFELCFNCHDTELLEKKYSETATNFRNGKQNLHYTHIHGNKGRNCNICHDMHASDNKFLIKKRTEFGTWNMPMNFKMQENGASCRTGCHEKKRYDRINPVKYNNSSENTDLKSDTIVDAETDTTKIENPDTLSDNPNKIITDSISEKSNVQTVRKDTIKPKIDSTAYIPETKTDTTTIPAINDNTLPESSKTLVDTFISKNNTQKIINSDTIKKDTVIITANSLIKTTNIETRETKENKDSLIKSAFEKIKPLRIFFDFDKTEITNQSKLKISQIKKFMKTYPEQFIIVCGYTDSIGSNTYNLDLSRKRAEAVKNLLTEKGILPDRIEIKAYGEKNPADTNKTKNGRANNRRTEIKLKNK